MNERFDATVIGAGAWRSAAAQRLAQRGLKVLCLDQYQPPHSYGSTHGRSRVIRPGTAMPRQNGPLIARAVELWRGLEQLTGSRLLDIVGFLLVGSKRSTRISEALDAQVVGEIIASLVLRESTLHSYFMSVGRLLQPI